MTSVKAFRPRVPAVRTARINSVHSASECGHSDLTAGGTQQPLYVVWVAGENRRLLAKGYGDHGRIDNIRGSAFAQQPSRFVRLAFAERNDRAPRQESPELGLLWRSAHLGDDRSRNRRNNAKFQARLVFCPYAPVGPIRRHENGSVVNNGAHAGRRTVRAALSCARTLRRASSISFALKRPCCFSHSATAAKPARR